MNYARLFPANTLILCITDTYGNTNNPRSMISWSGCRSGVYVNEPTRQQLVWTLVNNSSSELSFVDACKLLGYNPNDKDLCPAWEEPEVFENIFTRFEVKSGK